MFEELYLTLDEPTKYIRTNPDYDPEDEDLSDSYGQSRYGVANIFGDEIK